MEPETRGARLRWAVLEATIGNLVPLLGVMFLGWEAGLVLLLYWLESAVAGAYTIVKLVMTARLAALAIVPFFCFHYGLFMLVHLFLLGLFFLVGPLGGRGLDLVDTLNQAGVGVLFFLASHGISFVQDFLRGGQWQRVHFMKVMFEPYPRIFIMQFTLILGGIGFVALGEPMVLLVLLIVIKMAAEMVILVNRNRASPVPHA